jgi:hypothetical protein
MAAKQKTHATVTIGLNPPELCTPGYDLCPAPISIRITAARLAQSEGLAEMGLVTVQVWDATGNKRQDVEVPDDAPVNRILAVLLEKMKFPRYAPDGLPLSYKFHHKASGKQLLDTQTLASVGVKDGDVLRLQPEITAGV